jgi:glycine cleavage system regulatory protein
VDADSAAKSYVAVLAIGEDENGIVEAVTGVLTKHLCNIETSQMIVLGGQFSTALIASAHAELAVGDLESSLLAAGNHLKHWRAYVSPLTVDAFRPFSPEPSHSITTVSEDRSGIVHEISSVLARNRVNITTLSSGCSEEERSKCVIALDVTLPPAMTASHLENALRRIPDLESFDVEPLRRHQSTELG